MTQQTTQDTLITTMTRREHLSSKQLEGMLCDLTAWKEKIIAGKINMDVNLVNDDIEFVRKRINDLKIRR